MSVLDLGLVVAAVIAVPVGLVVMLLIDGMLITERDLEDYYGEE